MRWSHAVCWITTGLLLLGCAAGAADPNPVVVDERTLKAAGLATEGPDLLDFFRKRTLTDVERDKIQTLVRQLGDNSFKIRERASADLAARGITATVFLRPAVQDPDLEVARRAEECLRLIAKDYNGALPAAAARLLAARKPPGAAEVLLAYLPFADADQVAEEVQSTLAALAVHEGKPEPALAAALTDAMEVRRAAAAEAFCRAGVAAVLPAVRQLLKDPEPAVRLRVALALAGNREKEAVPVLIDLLAQLSPNQAYQAEAFLYRLAEEQAPMATPGHDEAARRQRRDAWAGWWQQHGATVDLARLTETPRLHGYSMVVLLDLGRVVELDGDNKPRWQLDGLQFPLDAQWLPGNRVLVAEQTGNRVTERNTKGEILWEKKVLAPLVAQRLPNGNTFIATQSQLLEVDRDGQEVFSHMRPDGETIMRAQKLRTGEIACVTTGQRFVRLDATGKELNSFSVMVNTSGGRIDVLPNGHVLVPQMAHHKVVEHDAAGRIVWHAFVRDPVSAVRLPNGHTLVTSMTQNRAIELDRAGQEVWEYRSTTRVTRAWRR
ncbi:MAG: HEAT repeat domain-containing protein [Gemmataceae bacterium]|nr:HEAT repeat domain-containing protein [Gemmataceae bacterium]